MGINLRFKYPILQRWSTFGASIQQLTEAVGTKWWKWPEDELKAASPCLQSDNIQDFINYIRTAYPYSFARVGQQFGELTVIEASTDWDCYCTCRCSCGKITYNCIRDLVEGFIWSCGCLRDCQSLRPLFPKWRSMMARCNNPKDSSYKNYGARGIRVCKEWEEFFVFEKWGNLSGYKPGLTIDRIDNNGNYCPENCRWATPKEQMRNTRRTKNITYKGKTQCIAAWEEELGLPRNVIWSRLNNNWSIEKALTTEY